MRYSGILQVFPLSLSPKPGALALTHESASRYSVKPLCSSEISSASIGYSIMSLTLSICFVLSLRSQITYSYWLSWLTEASTFSYIVTIYAEVYCGTLSKNKSSCVLSFSVTTSSSIGQSSLFILAISLSSKVSGFPKSSSVIFFGVNDASFWLLTFKLDSSSLIIAFLLKYSSTSKGYIFDFPTKWHIICLSFYIKLMWLYTERVYLYIANFWINPLHIILIGF